MGALEDYKASLAVQSELQEFCSKVGRHQPHLRESGKIHEVNVTVHFQPSTGANNYHEARELSHAARTALREAISARWQEITTLALASAADVAAKKRADAQHEYKQLFGEALQLPPPS